MITRIELDGFKTFQNFELELGPFQVIVGPNGSGKSNLFDALRFLAELRHWDLLSAFEVSRVRGETDRFFTILPNGQFAKEMRLAVELLIDRTLEAVPLTHTRLRYEIKISQVKNERGDESPQIIYESLTSISPAEDKWAKKYGLLSRLNWLPQDFSTQSSKVFISTRQEAGRILLILHKDNGMQQTIEAWNRHFLGSTLDDEASHVMAVRREMSRWRFLDLNPTELRYSRELRKHLPLSPGSIDIASILARMQVQDHLLLKDVSRDLANLVPEVLKIEVQKDPLRNEDIIWVKTQDDRSLTWQGISDGTLRLLVMATFANDPDYSGVLCFEEPENGVHPSRLKNIATLLRGLATDFLDPEQTDLPLRQLLVNTHSPVLISQPEIVDSLLFAYMVTRVKGDQGGPSLRVSRIVPVRSYRQTDQSESDQGEESYNLDQIRDYLNSTDVDEALAILERGQPV